MSELTSIYINGHGIQLHGLSQGHGPLVVFCHGFPGLAYSWRQQMQTVADQGFRALALDSSTQPIFPWFLDSATSGMIAVVTPSALPGIGRN